jgi:hypothetical protein
MGIVPVHATIAVEISPADFARPFLAGRLTLVPFSG